MNADFIVKQPAKTCFLVGPLFAARDAMWAAGSTLSKRSLKKNPTNHTKRLIRLVEANSSLNRLLEQIEPFERLKEQVLAARVELNKAFTATAAGDLTVAAAALEESSVTVSFALDDYLTAQETLRNVSVVAPVAAKEDGQ